MPSVCLVSSRHLSYNPRLYKEARALCDAGLSVRAVTPNLDAEKAAYDDELMETESWPLHRIAVQRQGKGRRRWMLDALRQRLLRTLTVLQHLPYGIERAYSRHVDGLYRAAAAQPADLYIAHNLQALPAAAWAADRHNARLGFDAEDFHRGEFPHGRLDDPVRRLTVAIEETYIPRCNHLTAASPGIADAYANALNCCRPVVVLNVFPKVERSGSTPSGALTREAPDDAYSLYWYSQTIGPNRGLEHVVRALGVLAAENESQEMILSLRGSWAEGFEARLRAIASASGVEGCLRHLPLAPPDQLIERAAQHDVGLALEQPVSRNREICVTNKLFAYLLAGLPVAATRTPGQEAVCRELPDATRLCETDDPCSIANAIQSLLRTPQAAQTAKNAAWKAGEERYNWDVEQERLVEAILQTLDAPPAHT